MTHLDLTDLEPETFHARRRLSDAGLLHDLTPAVRAAIYRAICPYCRVGAGESTVSLGINQMVWEHSVGGHTAVCLASTLRNELYVLGRYWENVNPPMLDEERK